MDLGLDAVSTQELHFQPKASQSKEGQGWSLDQVFEVLQSPFRITEGASEGRHSCNSGQEPHPLQTCQQSEIFLEAHY